MMSFYVWLCSFKRIKVAMIVTIMKANLSEAIFAKTYKLNLTMKNSLFLTCLTERFLVSYSKVKFTGKQNTKLKFDVCISIKAS